MDLDAGDSYLVEEGARFRAPFLFVGPFNCAPPFVSPAPQTLSFPQQKAHACAMSEKNRGGPQESLAVAAAEYVLREAAGRCVKTCVNNGSKQQTSRALHGPIIILSCRPARPSTSAPLARARLGRPLTLFSLSGCAPACGRVLTNEQLVGGAPGGRRARRKRARVARERESLGREKLRSRLSPSEGPRV